MCKRSAESTVQSHVRRAIEARRCGRRRLDAVSPDMASNVPFTPERHDKAQYRSQCSRTMATTFELPITVFPLPQAPAGSQFCPHG